MSKIDKIKGTIAWCRHTGDEYNKHADSLQAWLDAYLDRSWKFRLCQFTRKASEHRLVY